IHGIAGIRQRFGEPSHRTVAARSARARETLRRQSGDHHLRHLHEVPPRGIGRATDHPRERAGDIGRTPAWTGALARSGHPGANFTKPHDLLLSHRIVDVERLVRILGFHLVAVDDDYDLFAGIDRALELVGGVPDLALGEAGLDRFDHAAEGVDLLDVVEAAF